MHTSFLTKCKARGRVAALAALAIFSVIAVPRALAADRYWNTSSGNWSVSSNWNPQQVPTASDNVYIQNTGTAQITSGTSYADDLYIRSNSRLELQGGTLDMATGGSRQFIGHNGSVGTFVQSGGNNYVGYHMYLGHDSGSSGYYNMSNGYLYVDNTLYAGYDALGVFQQSGGSVSVNQLILGNNAYSSGTYQISGSGTLNVRSTYGIDVGTGDGYGRLEWFKEGGITTNKIDMGSNGTLAMGYDFSSIPSVVNNLQNATLEVTNNATVTKTNDGITSSVKYLRIGSSSGAGIGNQTGGTVQIGQAAYIGDGGTGVATQTGGNFNVTTHLYLGTNGGDGTYRLKGGTLSVSSNIFGGNGTSTLVLDGGILSLGGTYLGYKSGSDDWRIANLKLGDESGRTGSYTLVTGKQMNVIDQYLGVNGTGNFTQSGGTANVTNLRFGTQATGTGSYLLTGGTLNVSGQVYDGAGAGTLQIDGGTFNPSGNVAVDNLKVGITGAGSHTQTANTFTVGALTLGNATYHLRGGSLNTGGVANTTGTGTLNLDGGLFSPSGSVDVDNLGVGIAAAGSHTQTGQTYSVGTLSLGQGTYTLSGGTLATGSVANTTGTGTLALNGGTFNPSGNVNVDNLHIGVNATADHTLSSGIWQAGALAFGVTSGGNGALTLAGGTLDVTGDISTGSGSGTLILNGGSLSLGGGLAVTDLKVGVNATASHTQSSKTYDITDNLVVGSGSGNGTYRLQQTGQLQVGNKVQIGQSGGTGRFEWYRSGGLTTSGIELGASGTLAMGHDFDADALIGAGGLVSGLDNATLEITRSARATQDAGTVTVKTLRLGGADGSGTYRLENNGELDISSGGQLVIGSASGSGRFEWYREGGLTTPALRLGSTGTLAMGFDFNTAHLLDGSLFGGGTLMGIEGATLEITQGATATQMDGSVKIGTLTLGSSGQPGTYEALGGTLRATTLNVGMGGKGQLDLNTTAKVSVSGSLTFGPQAGLTASAASRITLDGADVWNYSRNAEGLADMVNLTLAFQPSFIAPPMNRMELAGEDLGATMDGFLSNFALDTLIIGNPGGGSGAYLQLVDWFPNQDPGPFSDALYVHNILVYNDSTLDMNFLNIYYDGLLVVEGTGQIINGVPQYIPEPAMISLLVLGWFALIRRRSHT